MERKHPGPADYALAVLALLAGFLVAVQGKANYSVRATAALPSRRLEELTVLIRRQQESDRMLHDEVTTLRSQLRAYRSAEARGQSLAHEMQAEVRRLRDMMGLARVHGPGLLVRLAASPNGLSVPQAQDVASVVNDLWAAGAEAVAVNGVRVLATDGFVQDAQRIRIGDARLSEPFSIVAIGDPVNLQGALAVPGGTVDGLRGVGVRVELSSVADATLPGYRGHFRFRLARPDRGP